MSMPGGKIDVVGNVKAEVLADLDRGFERINFLSVVRGSAWPGQRPLQALQIYPEPGFFASLMDRRGTDKRKLGTCSGRFTGKKPSTRRRPDRYRHGGR